MNFCDLLKIYDLLKFNIVNDRKLLLAIVDKDNKVEQ